MGPVESSVCLRVMHTCVFEQDSGTVPTEWHLGACGAGLVPGQA